MAGEATDLPELRDHVPQHWRTLAGLATATPQRVTREP